MSEPQVRGESIATPPTGTPEVVEDEIGVNRAGAMLIDWVAGGQQNLFSVSSENNPASAMQHSIEAFIDAGWEFKPLDGLLVKNGWKVSHRSQGGSARPIIQWSRI